MPLALKLIQQWPDDAAEDSGAGRPSLVAQKTQARVERRGRPCLYCNDSSLRISLAMWPPKRNSLQKVRTFERPCRRIAGAPWPVRRG